MSETYNNVPMSDRARASVARQDRFWDGPKLVVLSFLTLGVAFVVLWLAAEGILGPSVDEASWGQETHLLQADPGPRPLD